MAEKVIVEVRRADGLTARRGELDGFAGAMTRLRGAYDAMHQTWPMSSPPDVLIDAMQSGDRLGYHPESAREELAHFHEVLPQAQAAVAKLAQRLKPPRHFARMSKTIRRPSRNKPRNSADALNRAEKLGCRSRK